MGTSATHTDGEPAHRVQRGTISLTRGLIQGLVLTTLTSVACCAHADVPGKIGDVKLELSGLLMLDSALAKSTDRFDTRNFEVRRARLGLGAEWSDWDFQVTGNFSDKLNLQTLRLDYEGFESLEFSGGLMKEPFGMAELESSRNIPLMERPLASALSPSSNLGLDVNTWGDSWAATAGIFAPVVDVHEIVDPQNDSALTARVTGTPWHSESLLVHLGGALSLRYPQKNKVDFVASPESFLIKNLNINLLSEPSADVYHLTGLELAVRSGPRLLQADYMRADANGQGTGGAEFAGYYLQGSWVLTGEQRDYSTRRGTFDAPSPERPLTRQSLLTPLDLFTHGAWEVAARYSFLDLNDGRFNGDTGEAISLGLNWYPNDYVRLMLGGVHIRREQSNGNNDVENLIQARLQLYF